MAREMKSRCAISRSKMTNAVIQRRTILLIDDEELPRTAIKDLLELAGYHVLMVKDQSEGLNLCQRRHTSLGLVILNMLMPGMSGRDAYDTLRLIDPACPVVDRTLFSEVLLETWRGQH